MLHDLLSFIEKSPTAFHAADQLCKMFEKSGCVHLNERDAWHIEPGKRYVVTRNRSSVIAFSVPECGFAPMQICAAHSDSPTFKIKENAELETAGHYIRLDVERYGGLIINTWLDRPLSVAGRILVKTDTGVKTHLVDLKRDVTLIPNVAIHMNRAVNDGYRYNLAVDTMPLWGDMSAKGSFKHVIAESVGVKAENIFGSDLYLYNRTPASIWGANNEYFSYARLDDLECAYLASRAFTSAQYASHINMVCVFDNEEVGSGTKQGADSTFLWDVICRMAHSLGADEDTVQRALASSFMLSADNAHATHPNHPEYADTNNQAFMNEGIVIKFNANQKYTTDGVSEAVFHRILSDAGVPCQHFANRSDMAGGSTLGNISGSHVSINTLDIGLAQLAMHSSYETAGVKDVEYMVNGIRAFYETDITCVADGDYTITHV